MKRIFCFVLCALMAAAAFGQTDSHYRAAERMVKAAISEETYSKLIEQSLDQQINSTPSLAAYRQIMLDFFNKYMSFPAIKEDLIRLYMQYFTEAELLDILKFYESPIGRKASKLMPELFQAGAAIGQQKVQEHIGELEAAIRAAAEKE